MPRYAIVLPDDNCNSRSLASTQMEVEMDKKLKTSEAQRRAVEKYNSQFVELRVRMKPEEKKIVTEYASSRGESVNKMLLRLIREEMARVDKS